MCQAYYYFVASVYGCPSPMIFKTLPPEEGLLSSTMAELVK
jgi:hypothetical protein